MKPLLVLLISGSAALAAAQTDHDNIDKGRPLSFEDAEPIATRAMAYEFGLNVNFLRSRRLGFEIPFEFIWGAAPNTQFEIGTSGLFGDESRLKGLDLGLLYSFNRELPNTPAMALKFEVETERGETHYQVTGIATKTINQYDRMHLNLSGGTKWSAVLGLTKPLGYPRHFDTTGLAEVSLRQGDDGAVAGLGVGIRRQMNPRSVLDLGIQTELSGRDRVPFRLILGYATSM